jgi:Transposase
MNAVTIACCWDCVPVTPNDEVLGAWLAKESVRDVYLTDDPDDAAVLLDKAIIGCLEDDVLEIQSLGRTLAAWHDEILAHHTTGASNGPTEGLNLCVKKVKRCGHGFRSFENYRLRVLLHTGGVTWPTRPSPPRIRTRLPTQTRRASNEGTSVTMPADALGFLRGALPTQTRRATLPRLHPVPAFALVQH